MLKKTAIILSLILTVSVFNLSAAAQTVGEATFSVGASKLSAIDLPSGARQIKPESVPQEFKDTFAKLIAAGGDRIKQGGSEVIVWEGNYEKSSGSQMIKNLETTLKNSGWEYEVGAKESDFVLFSIFRAEPQRRALVGFFVPTEDAFVFALTEMVRADAIVETESETFGKQTIETTSAPKTNSTSGANGMNIYGKWYRGTGSGFIDYTGKTQYKSGESFYFEFFPDGTVEYTKEVDVLSIMQCKIKGADKGRGKFTISGNTLTINLGAVSSVETNSCDASKNFNKTLEPSTTKVQFEIKKMDSITRPDNPTIMCFNGKDDACYEKTNK